MDDRDDEQLSAREQADLARLADGILGARRRAALEARVAASPGLRALVDEQRRAVALVHGAGGGAPAGLRARLEAARRAAAPRARRWRVALGGGLAAAAAGTALALVFTLAGDVPGDPTVVQAAEVASRPPAAPAPAHDPVDPTRLAVSVDGVSFPNWDYNLHWRAIGRRTDRIDGRRVTTVYYARPGQVVGYAIVAGDRIRSPVASTAITVGDTTYRRFLAGGRTVVTWVRDGHTCVLTGAGVAGSVMVRLAAWKA